MAYLVCAEEMDGQWIAHVPDLPGCFATNADRERAIAAAPRAIEQYFNWAEAHGLRVPRPSPPLVVGEVIRSWVYEGDYEVNAFFASDRPPLDAEEIDEFRRLLEVTRADLLEEVKGLEPHQLDKQITGERWPIGGVLKHVANAELWYMDRLAVAFPKSDLPDDPLARLSKVREHLEQKIDGLAHWTGVVTLSGETWSARKVIRRTLWHERDHTLHIRKLLARVR
jgi:predicted RNase H-like HicB family nuclease